MDDLFEPYGRLIRNSSWRTWLRDNIHNRGLAPAGTGAGTGTTPGAQQGADQGAHPGAASFGKAAGRSGP